MWVVLLTDDKLIYLVGRGFMKGFVLSGALSFLENLFDQDVVWDQMDYREIPKGGIYSPMIDYPDESLQKFIEHVAGFLNMPCSRLSKIMGIHLFAELLSLNPSWVEQAGNTFELLKSHGTALNEDMERAFPGFIGPSFDCFEFSSDRMKINYKSLFLPADVAEGLIAAAAIHYNENFFIEPIKPDLTVNFNLQFILRRKCKNEIKAT